MSFIKEVFTFNNEFQFNLFQTSASSEYTPVLHCHDCLELNYISHGSGTYHIENAQCTICAGDIIVINNLEHHMAVSDGDLMMEVMVFDPKFVWENPADYNYLKPFFHRSPYFSNRIRPEDENYPELCTITKKIIEEWQNKKEGWQLIIKSMLMYLLAVLYRYYQQNDELSEDMQKFRKSYENIRQSVEYIHRNFNDEITLDILAREAAMNKAYFSSYFKQVMDVSVFEYIESVRISYACMLLRTTQKTITQIAVESGFNTVSYFNRVFRKCQNTTPKDYRLKTENSEISAK